VQPAITTRKTADTIADTIRYCLPEFIGYGHVRLGEKGNLSVIPHVSPAWGRNNRF
jgi:hypothetical protein